MQNFARRIGDLERAIAEKVSRQVVTMIFKLKDGRIVADCDYGLELHVKEKVPVQDEMEKVLGTCRVPYKYIAEPITLVKRFYDKDGNVLLEEPSHWGEYMEYRQERGLPCYGLNTVFCDEDGNYYDGEEEAREIEREYTERLKLAAEAERRENSEKNSGDVIQRGEK